MKKLFSILILCVMGLSLAACGDDEDDAQTLPDPEGTFETYLINESTNLASCYIKWSSPNNLVNTYNTYITDLGEKNGLAEVVKAQLPEYGSGAMNVACKPGHGYILMCGHNGYGAFTYYCGVYVVKNLKNQNGSIYGAEIKFISLGDSSNR